MSVKSDIQGHVYLCFYLNRNKTVEETHAFHVVLETLIKSRAYSLHTQGISNNEDMKARMVNNSLA